MPLVADRPSGIRALDQRIPFLLSQLGTYVADVFKRRLAPLGVHPRTNAVLVALAGDDGQSQRQLSARLGVHRNVMVSLIDTPTRGWSSAGHIRTTAARSR